MRSDELLLGRFWRVASRASALAALLAVLGCADFSRGLPVEDDEEPPPPAGEGDGGTSDVTFAADVHQTLLRGCQSCHSSGGSASTTSYVLSGDVDDDYAATVRFVDESAPSGSRLVSKAAGTGHAGGAIFPPGSDEHDLLLRWISQGALP